MAAPHHAAGNAGWTKFSNFADLYALTEEEWDKVGPESSMGISSEADGACSVVLGGKRQRPDGSSERSAAHV